MNRRDTLKGALALSSLAALPAVAQNLDRPVRFIVPFAPGGTSDIIARLLSPELTKSFGQNVVVENRTGASGNIGADLVAKSPPDGHTMLIIDVSTLATAPSLYTRFPFDLKRDLAPVTMLIYAPYILAVHPSVPVNNAAELVAVTWSSEPLKLVGLNYATLIPNPATLEHSAATPPCSTLKANRYRSLKQSRPALSNVR